MGGGELDSTPTQSNKRRQTVKEKLEKKEKEIQENFEKARAELQKIQARSAELMDLIKRLQGAYALIKEQIAELEKPSEKNKKK